MRLGGAMTHRRDRIRQVHSDGEHVVTLLQWTGELHLRNGGTEVKALVHHLCTVDEDLETYVPTCHILT